MTIARLTAIAWNPVGHPVVQPAAVSDGAARIKRVIPAAMALTNVSPKIHA
jgi:hypothetical protein